MICQSNRKSLGAMQAQLYFISLHARHGLNLDLSIYLENGAVKIPWTWAYTFQAVLWAQTWRNAWWI